jgi:hypothetical protein
MSIKRKSIHLDIYGEHIELLKEYNNIYKAQVIVLLIFSIIITLLLSLFLFN